MRRKSSSSEPRRGGEPTHRDEPWQYRFVPRGRLRRRIHLARIAAFPVVVLHSCGLTKGRSITLWRMGAHPSTPTAICAVATTSAC